MAFSRILEEIMLFWNGDAMHLQPMLGIISSALSPSTALRMS